MNPFKVICKKPNNTAWVYNKGQTKIVYKTSFFGLIKKPVVVSIEKENLGPSNDEICLVTDKEICNNNTYYTLAGYPYGTYNSKYFIPLDEFEEKESVSEIARNAKPVLN